MDEIVQHGTPAKRYCRKCLYELTCLPLNRCPECATEFDPNDPTSYLPSRNWFDRPHWYKRPRVRAALRAAPTVLTVLVVGFVVVMSILSLITARSDPLYVFCQVAMSNVRVAISIFESEHNSFPPNLQAIVVGQMVEDGMGCTDFPQDSPGFGYCYVTGLSPDDPDDWIILFDASCGIIQGTDGPGPHNDTCNVAYIGKETEGFSVDDFRKEFSRFHADFVKARGHPPAIQCPAPPSNPTP